MAYVRASERRRQFVDAARSVLSREGVAGTTLRAVATEAQVSVGTLYYIFPAKEQMITAVLEDVREEVSAVFEAADVGAGLGQAIRHGLESYWKKLVVNDPQLALMRHGCSPTPYAHPARSTWPAGRSRATPESSPSAASRPPATPVKSVPFPSTTLPERWSAA